MKGSSKTDRIVITRRLLIAEIISFVIGVAVIILESVAGITYFGFWFILIALINAAAIIVLVVKKPKSYFKHSVNLFVLPITCAWILYFVIRRMIN
jgi:hypothetical protein